MQTRHGKVAQSQSRKEIEDEAAFGRVPAFLLKTYDLVGDECNADIVSWEEDGQSFVIWQPAEFSRDLLPQYFKHSNLASFVRQLNTYGFQKASPDRWEFHNPNFKRARPELLTDIPRRRTTHKSSHAAAELGDEHHSLAEQVNMLKQDRRIIMLEVLKLQQTMQRSEAETQKLNGRLEKTEQAHNNLMRILTAAAKDPSILSCLVTSASSERLVIEGGATTGAKRQRSWEPDVSKQVVSRASVEAIWPALLADKQSLSAQHPNPGPLPAAAAKGISDEFTFVPVADGVSAAVSPFATSQSQDMPEQPQQDVVSPTEPPELSTARPESPAPVRLRSADLALPKSSAAGDEVWPLPSLTFGADWGSRGFDVLGSQPSWTFAAMGQGSELVH